MCHKCKEWTPSATELADMYGLTEEEREEVSRTFPSVHRAYGARGIDSEMVESYVYRKSRGIEIRFMN